MRAVAPLRPHGFLFLSCPSTYGGQRWAWPLTPAGGRQREQMNFCSLADATWILFISNSGVGIYQQGTSVVDGGTVPQVVPVWPLP